MAISITKPTVGGNEDTWGSTINTALDTIIDAVNGTSGTTAPNLSTLTINGTNVTATAAELNIMDGVTATTAELNKIDGFTGTFEDLNYAKDLRSTGVTSTEFNFLDTVSSNIQTQLNAKQATITGGATTIDTENLTASRVLVSNSSGKVAVSSVTSSELAKIDGLTASASELNKLDGATVTTGEINVLDGNTSATSTTVAAADRVVFNDNGTMKQVSMNDIATYTSSQVSSPTVNNPTITIDAGQNIDGGGTFTLNQSGNTTITLNHTDTSGQASVNNSGSNVIQDVILDGFGHVVGLTSTDVSSTVSPVFASNSVHHAATSITVAAGMYMISCYSTATTNSGQLNLPTTNVTFGMINMIKGTSNTQNAVSVNYLYNGSNWREGANTSFNATGVPITNSTSGTQNISFAWGFISFSGASTLSTNNSNTKINAVRVG